MYKFLSKQNRELSMDLEGGGISFHYDIGGGIFHVGQSWASVHALLAKLRKYQEYSAWDRSLSVSMQDHELCLLFRHRDRKSYEACILSPDETTKIMEFLERAPNLN